MEGVVLCVPGAQSGDVMGVRIIFIVNPVHVVPGGVSGAGAGASVSGGRWVRG